jgi:hypothetical protein
VENGIDNQAIKLTAVTRIKVLNFMCCSPSQIEIPMGSKRPATLQDAAVKFNAPALTSR